MLALPAAVPVLVGVIWFDLVVVARAMANAAHGSNLSTEATIGDPVWSLGHLAIGGAALALAWLAWWSRSAVVGTLYLVVGVVFALYPWKQDLVPSDFQSVTYPIVLPTPLTSALRDAGFAFLGPLDAVVTIGGVMAIAGVFVIGRLLRDRKLVVQSDSPLPHDERNLVKLGRVVLALVVAGVSLAAMAWMDSTLGDKFSGTSRDSLLHGARLTVAGLALVLGFLAWRARSALVGVMYAIAGSFFVFLPAIVWNLSSAIPRGPGDIGSTAVLSGPLATMAHDIWAAVQGPIAATDIVGGAMLVAGLAVLARSLWHWVAAGDPNSAPAPLASQPTRP